MGGFTAISPLVAGGGIFISFYMPVFSVYHFENSSQPVETPCGRS